MQQIDEVVSTKPSVKKIMRFFKLERAPENIPSVSILIGSLYREIELSKATEDTTNTYAKKLYDKINSQDEIGSLFSNQQLSSLFNSCLSVPKSSAQKKKEKFFLSPFVPSTGSYGLAARNTKGAWNPGGLIIEILANYSPSKDEFINICRLLHKSLTIEGKDPWASLISNEFQSINSNIGVLVNNDFDESKFRDKYGDDKYFKNIIQYSNQAKRFFSDLHTIIQLKNSLTRQKWIGVLEAYLRITLFNHIIYTMNLSRTYISFIQHKIDSNEDAIDEDLEFYLNQSLSREYVMMDVDTKRTAYIETNVRKYCYYNTILDSIILNYNGDRFEDFNSREHFVDFSNKLIRNIKNAKIDLNDFIVDYKNEHESMLDNISSVYPKTLKNAKECLEYLCQKKKTTKSDTSPDVNYIFDREFHKGNSPYRFDLSAGIISTLCCLIFSKISKDQNFISGVEFIKHIKEYNINLNIKDISEGRIKNTMQSLGVIIDSPDTEGGVLILRPGWI